ncbi:MULTISPECIES: hypothetical protein [Methanobacterium]|uniref:Uncharacterized protein n=1 Tax=Methanobacterium bryantii TaxID=2161 RepID=A0A2A2H5P2_METBR|nr:MULTISPECIES: hypothetical protein [Methanobacterium]OEC88375.1 hypothetical protein A9507_05300 [Methanobacterium sp. A39]PAV04593.1 hypothetical protein ASJ80_06715 [Methanobacterium bryantii]
MVIVLIKLIYRHNPPGNVQYGNEIILFHSDERFKKRVWRFNLIEELKNLKNKGKITGELELKLVVGEFSEDTQEIVKHAINHKFRLITIIAGPKIFCEDKTEIYTLLDKYKSVKYFILPIRPIKHFMILSINSQNLLEPSKNSVFRKFNNGHLYIEKPHRHNESRGSVGVKNSNPGLIKIYVNAFNEMLEHAQLLTKDEVLNQQCYNE